MTQEINDKNKIIDSKLIPLSQAAKRSGYTPEHLNLSARKGKLQAQKIGRNWYTTIEWLDAFLNLAMEKNAEKKEALADGRSGEVAKASGSPESLTMSESRGGDSDEEELSSELLASLELLTTSELQSGAEEKNSKEKKSFKKNLSRSWMQTLAGVSAMLIVIPIIFFSVYSVKFYAAQKNNQEKKIAMINEAPVEIIQNENGNSFIGESAEEKVLGIVRGEETAADVEAEKKSGVVLASENFKAQNVSMGVGIVLASAEENAPLEISDIRSESFITGKKDSANSQEEVKLVVSWKTNKLAMSELNFSKNNGQDQKVLKEQSFGFSHAVVLTGIDPRTSYVYQVKGKDHWGTQVSSDFYGIFTASKPISVFDLISNQINEIFGWAIKQ